MAEFLAAASGFILAMTALGLARLLWGPGSADRLMSAQLLGTGGVASALLIAIATNTLAVVDVALTLALLAVFVSIAFARGMSDRASENGRGAAGR